MNKKLQLAERSGRASPECPGILTERPALGWGSGTASLEKVLFKPQMEKAAKTRLRRVPESVLCVYGGSLGSNPISGS